MFQKLRQRWGVSPGRMVLILCTFAIGGSLCGYAARKLLLLLDIAGGTGWWVLYLVLVTVLWPFAVLLVGILTGQFSFFKSYLRRISLRMGFGKRTGHEKSGKATTKPLDPM